MNTKRNGQQLPRAGGAAYYYAALTGTAALGGTVAVIFDTGRAPLAFASIGALALTLLIYHGIVALLPELLVPRLIPLSFALQLLALVSLGTLGTRTMSPSDPAFDIADFPFTVTFALLLGPLASLVAAAMVRFFGQSRGTTASIEGDDGLHLYLAFAAVLKLLYWPASLDSLQQEGYLIRVMEHSLGLVPVLAGRFLVGPSFTRNLWLGCMALNATIGLAVGSRAVALMPPCLFAIGHISGLSGALRRRAVWLALAAAVPTVLISGVVGQVRDTIGRGGLELFSTERIADVITLSSALLQEGGDDEALGEQLAFQGVARMFAWTNAVVPIASPRLLPYRGLNDIPQEIAGYAQISHLSGQSRQDMYDADLSTAPANLYGFTVDTGTSVEFGLVPDGWSRGGPPIVLLFGFIYTLFLIGLEKGVRALSTQAPPVAAMLLAILAKVAIDINVNPMLLVLRTLTLNVTFFLLLLTIAELLRELMRVRVPVQ